MSKLTDLETAIASVPDRATVVIGGAGLCRKPMTLVQALARSDVTDLTVISWVGGPDVDLLIGAGKVQRVVYGYVGLEAAGLAPNFRRARQEGGFRTNEWSEHLVITGLEAAARRLPFLPSRSGLGTDVVDVDTALTLFEDPVDGQTLVAVPALRADVALIHVNQATASGFGRIIGEPYVDPLCAWAADETILSAESVIEDDELTNAPHLNKLIPPFVTHVVDAPFGAGFTSCYPDYPLDLATADEYRSSAGDDDGIRRWLNEPHRSDVKMEL